MKGHSNSFVCLLQAEIYGAHNKESYFFNLYKCRRCPLLAYICYACLVGKTACRNKPSLKLNSQIYVYKIWVIACRLYTRCGYVWICNNAVWIHIYHFTYIYTADNDPQIMYSDYCDLVFRR